MSKPNRQLALTLGVALGVCGAISIVAIKSKRRRRRDEGLATPPSPPSTSFLFGHLAVFSEPNQHDILCDVGVLGC